MLRNVLPILLAIGIALVGGIYSAEFVTSKFEGFEQIKYGVWTAHPKLGTTNADAYSAARVARTGKIALGSAEGLSFIAGSDSDGSVLTGNCSYVVKGQTPAARYWTLQITDTYLRALPASNAAESSIHSGNVLRFQDGSFEINIASQPMPGNWLMANGNAPIFLILNLYDTGIATSTGATSILMPTIIRKGCTIG